MNSKFKIQNSKLWLTLTVVVGVCSFFVATAQDEGTTTPNNTPKVSGQVEPDSIGIGDRFTYSIDVEKDLMQDVFFPNFGFSGELEGLVVSRPSGSSVR